MIQDGNRLLLGMKKKGFGKDKYNGFGGKVEAGETVEQAAIRELKEECGLTANTCKKLAELTFKFPHKPESAAEKGVQITGASYFAAR